MRRCTRPQWNPAAVAHSMPSPKRYRIMAVGWSGLIALNMPIRGRAQDRRCAADAAGPLAAFIREQQNTWRPIVTRVLAEQRRN